MKWIVRRVSRCAGNESLTGRKSSRNGAVSSDGIARAEFGDWLHFRRREENATTVEIEGGTGDSGADGIDRKRESKPEGGAFAERALYAHFSAHEFGKAHGDREAKTGAAVMTRGRGVGLGKFFKYGIELFLAGCRFLCRRQRISHE